MFVQIENNKIMAASAGIFEGATHEFPEINFEDYCEYPNKYIFNGKEVIINPSFEKEMKEEQEAEFNRQFFNTSLGYVRRNVTMKNGAIKDFLCDILPLLRVGVQILTYTKDLEQNKVLVTAEFLEECSQQVFKDFYGE